MSRRLKSFEELISNLEEGDEEEDEITNEEIDIRAEVFLNAFKLAGNLQKERINNLSFQLNGKFVEGCQAPELIQFYNEEVGRFLDDFIF